ncbi:conjugal transfer protein [Streptomyces sp. NPDC101151]|uniref:conjugal transfer protein n=1 Tax=Streptomyces sp. NPDC101151 TaxID=3366115 RepID=UPI00380BB023
MAVWTVIAAGPIALCVAVASTPTTVQAATPAKPTTVRTAAAADPGGYAQVFVSAWLRSSMDEAMSAQVRLAQSMAPGVDLPDPASDAQSRPQSVTAVRSAQRDGGAWSVTLAAQHADGSVRYYAMPVATDRAGASFAVTGAPGVVAGPTQAEVPKSPYGVTVPEGDLSSTVGEFLAAYLTGAGGVDRYVAPGVTLAPVSSAPYSAVSVEEAAASPNAPPNAVLAPSVVVRSIAEVPTPFF